MTNFFNKYFELLTERNQMKGLRFSALLFGDVIISISSLFIAIQLRFGFTFPDEYQPYFWKWALGLILLKFILLNYFNLYSFSLRFAGIYEFFRMIKAFFLFLAVASMINLWLLRPSFPALSPPYGVIIIDSMISFSLFGFIRLIRRLYFEFFKPKDSGSKRTLIVGANIKSERLIKDMRLSKTGLLPMAIADDFSEKLGREIYGLPVIDFKRDVTRTIRMNRIETALINLPKAGHKEVSVVFNRLKKAGLKDIRIVPRMDEWKESVNQIHPINIDDLLSRQTVRIDMEKISEAMCGKTVMVTGGAGSIGSEIVRKLRDLRVQRVIAVDMDESGLFNLQQELLPLLADGQQYVYVVASICNQRKMEAVFRAHAPQIVFHAAAYKHVPLMEVFPEEALGTNVLGTIDLARKAMEHGTEKFVNISTDKAVKPCSVMGASKRLAEMACQALNGNGTRFLSVRFGNVLGSRGSVVPVFQEQIKRGGPLTLTHPDMRRYFMSISEAVLLVFQAAFQGKGGEVFVLDMGDPVYVRNLAENLIRLNGLEPGKDIEIVETGIRPGEKLFEELLTAEEGVEATSHDKIYVARFKESLAADFVERMTSDSQAAGHDSEKIRALFASYIPSYCQK